MLTQMVQSRYFAPGVLGGAFFLMVLLERLWPLRARTRPQPGRLATNFMVTGVGFLAGMLAVKSAALGVAGLATQYRFGLLLAFDLPAPVYWVLGFLLMDVSFYAWHRTNHEVGLLWRFHSVHHADPDMDVSTSFRFHFGEVLYSTAFRVAQVAILGITPALYLAYELAFQLATMFHHGNLRLPLGAERLLNRVLVTPRMHGVHHSRVREENDSNYSVIFRWWDALMGSLRLNVPQAEITIGVAGRKEPEHNRFLRLMAQPFAAPPEGGTAEGERSREELREFGSETRVMAR